MSITVWVHCRWLAWRLEVGMTLGGNVSLNYNSKIMQVAALTHILQAE